MSGTDAPAPFPAEALKTCCAAAYSQDVVALVLGDSYHPGGLDLTRRLARAVGLRPGQRVLDVASGPGTTACLLAGEFGVDIDGVDLAEGLVEKARTAAAHLGLAGRVNFHLGDAERLPFEDGVFDAVVCECALCTFPDQAMAAAEFARVLRPGGRAGMTDVTLDPARLNPELGTLAGFVACIAGARPASKYAGLLAGAGLEVEVSERHDEALARMIEQMEGRLRALALIGPSSGTVDLGAILRYTGAAARAVADGVAGYHLIVARKPDGKGTEARRGP